ncbi:MAG: LysR substrate-binding domain-containing protein [Burkholderia contaminans]|uniref:LysR substrate-binding domain-containing protein n=1 Tax=Burkholderia contaminans TaxID=488447 RepID=A0AAP4QYY3_9BURK|nr:MULTISPECIES: LysR substrate-binding domain-containing protein [Burkholderia]MBD1410591.1 LysR family transcriptional regulator [Burkholderia contaminans]MBH9668088.1 LysR family transcriptional regulator [Burkholderia contaminans]MBH9678255.1 LysR family transcriptional regulator [Burkholderia contaminans]MBH9705316.1 LysR family transcriptional regulator [Burkholderia contaminans]MBH9721878.1 LysR family transcriptional regulator [Burkholderia contaminans]
MERMWPGTRALRTFDAAARHLNFSRAADEVGLTPAAVSHQIKEIEAQLDMALFVRTSRSIRLTPAGVVLAAAAAEALAGLQRATARARRVAREQTELRVSVGARFATHWLLPRMPRFRAEHPAFELSFDITDRLRDFDDDDIDVAIRYGTGRDRDACAQRLFDTSVVAICSPALLSAGPPLRKPRDLLRHTLCHVDCEVDGVTWPRWSAWMAAAGVDGFDDSRCVSFPDSSHVVQAVTDGTAIGLAEPRMIARDLAEGRVVQLFDVNVEVAPGLAYHVVYPERTQDDPRIVALRDWLADEVATMCV